MSNHRPPIDYIQRTRDQYDALGYTPYTWVHNSDDPPFAPLKKPLARCKVALIASGGIYVEGQIAFHFKDDHSFRVIHTDVDTAQLRATHFAYDLTDARADPNVVFPIDTLRALAAAGDIGGLTEHAYTFMGGIYSARKVRDELAPAIAERVQRDGADLAFLVPV